MRDFCRFMDQLAGVSVQQSSIGMFEANICVNAKKLQLIPMLILQVILFVAR